MFFLLESQPFCLNNWSQRLFALLVLLSALGVFAFYRLYHIIFHCDEQRQWFWPNFCPEDCEHRKVEKTYLFCIMQICKLKKKNESCGENENCGRKIKDCWTYIDRTKNTEWYMQGYLIAIYFYLIPALSFIAKYIFNLDIVWTLLVASTLYSIFVIIFGIEYLRGR